MILKKQTRLHRGMKPKERGNCFPAVIACILEMEVEDVLQVQELYDGDWYIELCGWLFERGWELETVNGHLYNDEYYFVSGKSPRGVNHITIYQNGNMIHDPHPDNNGILTEDHFEQLVRIS